MRAFVRVVPRVCAAVIVTVLLCAAPPALAQAPAPAGVGARPLTLGEALGLAAQANHSLRVAAFEVTVARSQVAQAEALRRGVLTLGASYTRLNERPGGVIVIPAGTLPPPLDGQPITIPLPPPTPTLYQVGLTYQIALTSGGRNEAQLALAQANLTGAEATLARATQQVVLEVKQAYYQVLLAQAGLEVAQRTATAAEENLRVARARVAAGAAPRFDEVQAEVNLAAARQGLVRARNSLALAQHGLNAVLGQPLDTIWAPRETMTILPVRTAPAVLRQRALEARPELAEVRARIAAAEAAIAIVRAGTRPLVVAQGGPTWGNTTGTTSTGTAGVGWSVTLSATLTLFDGQLTAERLREAEARAAQLRATEAHLRQTVELEVRRALLTHASAVEELATADKTIEQAQEGYRIATVRFAAGVSTTLEVVQAQAALSQAEAHRIQALFNVNLARAQLERAIGGPVE
ncbi:MAG: TolC family protein [Armatimonadota bacterium]|nr:TolC family protein [Armatimonadota bacterium]